MPGVVLISLITCLEIENDRKFEKYTNQTRKYLHALSRSLTRARGTQNYVAAVEFGVEVGIEKWSEKIMQYLNILYIARGERRAEKKNDSQASERA